MLTAIETVALSKAVKDTAVRESRTQLSEGHHDVDFTVRVHGPPLVAPPSLAKTKETLPAAVLVGLLLDQMTRAARNKVAASVAQALTDWREEGELPFVGPEATASAELLAEGAVRVRETIKHGNVTAPLSVELLARCGRAVAA